MIALARGMVDYEGLSVPASGFVKAADPSLPDRYQAESGDAVWQQALQIGAKARSGNPRLN